MEARLQPANPFKLSLPEGMEFGAIYADPPWPLDQENTFYRRRRLQYPRMSFDEIASVPVNLVAHPDAHLWLWTTNTHLKMALDVVEAWGFNYKTMATWRKTKITTGWWLRGRTEHLILAARTDKLRHNPGTFTTEIVGDWRGHSLKPPNVREMIEQLSPGPYLELFSREPSERERWHQLGFPLGGDLAPQEAFGQLHMHKGAIPDPQDGKVRGVAGLEIYPKRHYTLLKKVLITERVVAVEQKARRVKIRLDDGTLKWVSIDSLRPKNYKV